MPDEQKAQKATPAHKTVRRHTLRRDYSFQELKNPAIGASATIGTILDALLDIISPIKQGQNVELPNESGVRDPTLFRRMLKQQGLDQGLE